MDNGMTRDEYHFFLNNNLKHHCIMGNDYYQTNEHYVSADGSTALVRRDLRLRRDHPPVLQPLPAAGDAYRDQHLPRARTATKPSTGCARSGRTCCGCATTACRSSASPGISLTDQVDWDTACARGTAAGSTWSRWACSTCPRRPPAGADHHPPGRPRYLPPTSDTDRDWMRCRCCRPRASACRCRSGRSPAASAARADSAVPSGC
jgi:hypothetical protein